MAKFFQITVNEVLSGISKAIYEAYDSNLSIYKEKQEYIELPGVCIYCINYEQIMGRNDRFTNTFDIIINYFPDDNDIINNKRPEMFSEAQKIMNAIQYINLPAYQINNNGELIETTLPNRVQNLSVEEQEDHMQISCRYVVRTKEYSNDKTKRMEQLSIDITHKQ